jgi:hypothetical protein
LYPNWENIATTVIRIWEKSHTDVIRFVTKCYEAGLLAIPTGLEPATSTVTG